MASIKYWDKETGEWKRIDYGLSSDSSQNVAYEPAEDDIPKVFFGGTLQQTKDEKVVSFRYISKTQDISGYAEIKAQGNSSMSYPKKNQTVKLYKDADCTEKLKVDFKGWGEQRKFCFKANWIDLTHARNVVSARLWADIVKSRANFAELPELYRTSPNIGAVDGFPVKVYAAGVYQGRYTLNIPKDAWMANMDDELDEHCILCGEGYVSGCFREASMGQWTDEVHDSCPTIISTRWKEFINYVMNSTDDEFKVGLSDYFYVDSLIDYHLFNLANCGLDAYGKNQLYMTYDGQKWIACMYDMDATWGLYFNGASFVATDYDRNKYQDFVDGEGNLLFIRLEQLFYEELQTRWAELKNGALSMTNIINRFERFTDIAPAELVAEDYASTTGGGSFTGIPSQSTNNIQQIRNFALERQTWTDEYISRLTPPVMCTGITLSAKELTFDGTGSQTLIATVTPEDTTESIVWSSDNNSVATVFDGVVTAWSNGNAVITATCGDYSATCSVRVGEISSIDYTLNPLDEIEWEANYYYNTAGVKTAKTGENCTPKFEVQPCTYKLSGGNYSAMYVWDENDNFVGSIQKEISICFPAGYKAALKSYGTDFDPTTVSFMPVDNSETAVYTEISLADLTWIAKSNCMEASLPSAVAVDIDSSNYACFHSAGYACFPSGISAIGFALHQSGSLGYETIACGGFGTDTDAATAYFTENGTKLLLNERYK